MPEMGERDPLRVVQATRLNFDLRLTREVDPAPIDKYFQEVTFPYLDRVTAAIDEHFDPTRPRIRSITHDGIHEVLEDTNYDRASVDFFAVIFNALPDEFKPPFLPMGYSRRLEMAPPSTPSEMRFRVQEIGQVIRSFMTGVRGLQDLGVTRHHTPSIRTLAFLRVGSTLPLRTPTSETETLDFFEDSLRDVDMTVPDSEYHLKQVELADEARKERAIDNLLKGIDLDQD